MTKRAIYIFAISIVVFLVEVSCSASVFAVEGDTWIIPANQTMRLNQNFDIEIHLDTGGKDVGAFNMYFDFDPSQISVDITQGNNGLENGTDTTGYMVVSNADDITNGHYRFAGITSSDYANGSDVHLITIHAKTILSATSGNTALIVRVNELSDALGYSMGVGTVTNGVITIDATPPTLTQVTPISSPTSDTTPSYTFNTTEAGTIAYGGDCASTTTDATEGDNTITFNALENGIYTNCTIIVTDALSNASSVLDVNDFTVDTTVLTITETTPVVTPTNDNTPTYVYTATNLTGTATADWGGACDGYFAETPDGVGAGGNSATASSAMPDGTYDDCTLSVFVYGEAQTSNTLNITPFTIDATPPTLTQVTPISSPTSDTTPSYTFNTTEAGTIAYGGDCASTTTDATEGDNTITFNALENGIYTNCTIIVTDALSNASSVLDVNDFTVEKSVPVCDANHYDLCTNATTCDDAGGFWCSNMCKEESCDEPEEGDNVFTQISDIVFKQNNNKYELSSKSSNYVKKRELIFEGVEKSLVGGTVKLYVDGDEEEKENIKSDGEWKIKYKAKKNSNEKYKLKFYNKNGNEVDSKSYKIRIDTEDPIIEIPDYLNKRSGTVLWWNLKDNHKLKKTYIYWDGKKYKYKLKNVQKGEERRQDFIIPANTAKGEHSVRIKVYDKAGNKTIRYMTVNVY